MIELRKDEREKGLKSWRPLGRSVFCISVSKRPDLGSQPLGMRETSSKEVSVIGMRSGQGIRKQ